MGFFEDWWYFFCPKKLFMAFDVLRYEKGLSKYSIVRSLFPDDSYTHRMKRLQRAARQNVWTKHFDFLRVYESHYFVYRLVPKDLSKVLWNPDGTGYVHLASIRSIFDDLLFDHERQKRAPKVTFWSKTINYLFNSISSFWLTQ